MGREIKRVAVDFDWPLHEVWQGYVMPDALESAPCSECRQTGTTPARQWVSQIAHLLLMLDDDLNAQARSRPMHPYFSDTGSRAWGVRPSEDIREFGVGLAGREASFIGHDAIDGLHAVDKVIRAAGLDPDVWGICQACGGHGSTERYPGQSADADAWESTEPPSGDGWQLWETVSEGSPISSVFATRDEFVTWLSTEYRMVGGGQMTREQAEAFVDSGWAPSFVFSPSAGLVSGEQFIGRAS